MIKRKGVEIENLDIKKLKPKLKSLKQKGARLMTISEFNDQIIYHLNLKGEIINLKVKLGPKHPVIDSITKIYPNANLYERELMEKSKIKIRNHPNPKKLFTE